MISENSGVRALFDKFFNGEKNFITPHPQKYGTITAGKEQYIYEISQGSGMFGGTTTGVTILKLNKSGNPERTELNKCMENKGGRNGREEAEEYIKKIREDLRNAKHK